MTEPAISALTAARHQLVTDLAGLGVPVSPSWPTPVVPPCAYVIPPLAGDYLRRGPAFGEYTVTLSLVLLAGHGGSAGSLSLLESMLCYAVVNTAGNWDLVSVDPPAATTVSENGAEYLGAVITLSYFIRL